MRRRYPVDRCLYLSAVGGIAASRCGVVDAAQFGDLALGVFDDFAAGQKICVAQANFGPGESRKNFFGGLSIKSSCSM